MDRIQDYDVSNDGHRPDFDNGNATNAKSSRQTTESVLVVVVVVSTIAPRHGRSPTAQNASLYNSSVSFVIQVLVPFLFLFSFHGRQGNGRRPLFHNVSKGTSQILLARPGGRVALFGENLFPFVVVREYFQYFRVGRLNGWYQGPSGFLSKDVREE